MAAINPPANLQNRADHTAQMDRLALGASLWPGATLSGAFQARSGVLYGGGGGAASDDGLQVQAQGTPNMTVKVRPGIAIIQGTENPFQGTYICFNDSDVNITVPTADVTNPRKDIIVARVLDQVYSGASNLWELILVQGTPAGTPTEPAVPSNATKLAVILVAAGATSIGASAITDSRVYTVARGGMVPCLSTARPTTPVIPGLIFETDTKKAWLYDGTAFKQILVDGTAWGSAAMQPQKYSNSAQSSTNTGTTFINDSVSSVVQGLTFVAPPSGKVWLHHWVKLTQEEIANNESEAKAVVRSGGTIGSGTIVYDSASADSILHLTGTPINSGATGSFFALSSTLSCLVTGLTPGTTYNTHLQHRVQASGGTQECFITGRAIQVQPVW